jgi:hypothetical protein
MRNGRLALILVFACMAVAGVSAQSPAPRPTENATMLVRVPGAQYGHPVIGEFFAGSNWRNVWTLPVRVRVLDLATFAGGLKATEAGGNQSRTLRFKGEDGRTYIFRSTDKFMKRALPSDLKDTPIGNLMQDASSSLHPTGALVVAPLQEIVGLLQAVPTLVILPNDERLGEFRDQYAGMMGQFEERPDEAEEGVKAFANADNIVGTEKLLEELEESTDNRLESRDYLSARLIDFLIGDSDRGADQWRWARFDKGDLRTWRPIPRDRDYAFMTSEGLIGLLGRAVLPKLVVYKREMPRIESLTFMTRDFDRSHLVDLPWAAWDSIVTRLETGLTDAVIQDAMNRLPEEQRPLSGRIADGLRARRGQLREIAREYYQMVANEADVFGSNVDERAVISRGAEGMVEVSLFSKKSGNVARFTRTFHRLETREIRVYMQGGDDHVTVRGSVPNSIKVRVIGGAGDDVLIDSSSVAGIRDATVFYDATGKNQIQPGPSTRVSRAPFETAQPLAEIDGEPQKQNPDLPPEERRGVFQDLQNNQADYLTDKTSASSNRFWGVRGGFSPILDYEEGAGVIVGGGISRTTYGFRHDPYQTRAKFDLLYGLRHGGLGGEAFLEHRFESSRALINFFARATQFEANRFYGYGNDTERVDRDLALVMRDEVLVHPAIGWSTGKARYLTIGPVVRHVSAHPEEDSPAAEGVTGVSQRYGQAGLQLDYVGDYRSIGENRRGFAVRASASAFPSVWDVTSSYGRAELQGTLYVPLKKPTLALRAGATRVFGDDFPLHDAAFLGGRKSLRGYRWNRFAGDTGLHGGAELQVPVGEITLLSRTRVGVFGLADIGRVWFNGSSEGGWHTSKGGGLWLETLRQSVSVAYAHGEEGRIYLQYGWPF